MNELTESNSIKSKLSVSILDLISHTPISTLMQSSTPDVAAKNIASKAASQAAMTAGTLALPPGVLGWVTIVPEIITVWRIQATMVSDIAAVYGKSGSLNRESMIYCLFKHTAAQATRDLLVRVGERLIIKRATSQVLQKIAHAIGIKVSQRAITKAASRWVPLIGAAGVAGYAAYDTKQVAKSAMALFSEQL
ncbi:MAG: hypothetical protein KAZ68_03205 [Candidatus Methylopumilus sp.]|nr:hypothetical protein [Candidatus Methylopumilus sp.]